MSAKPVLSLPAEPRRLLRSFADEHAESIDSDKSTRTNHELRSFWTKYIHENPQKFGAFVGVLRELRPAITGDDELLEWYQLVVKSVIGNTGYKRAAVEDAQDFLVGVMVYDENEENHERRAETSSRLCTEMLRFYLSRTRSLTDEDQYVASENTQIAHQVETVLVAFGAKMPKNLFQAIDGLVVASDTRLQALTLLGSFLRHQAPHLYLVLQTSLVDHLLQCLMNDTSMTVLSIALTCLIMLLPHIPGSLNTHLPRLFLIYSRLLCWEKFSPLSTEAQKNLVTDDRVSTDPDGQDDQGDVGIDPQWAKLRPEEGIIEASTPELMTYFTYLYGLYPLNFMGYIRRPRKYLKSANFPNADDFDLDQAVIRSRSDQYRQAHLMHPNFYLSTTEEELTDPKWPKSDPADVVAECHSLCIHTRPPLISPGPPPTTKLPDVPSVPAIPPGSHGAISPSISHTSLRSGHSWRDTPSTAVSAVAAEPESPVLGPRSRQSEEDFRENLRPRSKGSARASRLSTAVDESMLPPRAISRSDKSDGPQTNLAYLQREIMLLRNDLNFERWHKAQYSQHIGQLMRKNVKDATVEAETLNLINANRALKQQLEQIRTAREATIRDSTLTRKQANNLEANMTERLSKMKKEQEVWTTDAEELRRLRTEIKQHRDLLSAAEARELNKSHQLEMARREVDDRHKLESQLQDSQRRIREYEYREFDFDQAKREQEILQSETETLQMKMHRLEQDRERMRRVYTDRVAELEIQLENLSATHEQSPLSPTSPEPHVFMQLSATDASTKLSQLKKAHSRLLQKFTDLELEYQSVECRLETLQSLTGYGVDASRPASRRNDNSFRGRGEAVMSGGLGHVGVLESVYDTTTDDGLRTTMTRASTVGPGSRRDPSPSLTNTSSLTTTTTSEATILTQAGLTWEGEGSTRQLEELTYVPTAYNVTAPLGADERSVYGVQSNASSENQSKKKEKITPASQMRVYGRGMFSRASLPPFTLSRKISISRHPRTL